MGRPKGVKNKIKDIESEAFGNADSVLETTTSANINKVEIDLAEVNHEIDKALNKNDDEYNIEVIRDYYGRIDPFYLSKADPNNAYRFLRATDSNLSIKTGNLLFQQGGWKLCPREHLLKIGVAERFISTDGLYRVGENVLAYMPKKLFEEKEKEKQRRAKAPMEAITKKLKHGDNSRELSGGIHPTMRGIETSESLGMGRSV